jgi:hypothetical protein
VRGHAKERERPMALSAAAAFLVARFARVDLGWRLAR